MHKRGALMGKTPAKSDGVGIRRTLISVGVAIAALPFSAWAGSIEGIPVTRDDPRCSGGLVLDDGTFDDAFGGSEGNATVEFSAALTPRVFPSKLGSVCLAFFQTTGTTQLSFDIQMFDDQGTDHRGSIGAPGTLLATIPAHVSNIPAFSNDAPNTQFYFFDVASAAPMLTAGKALVGPKWNPTTYPNVFLGVDMTATTPIADGWSRNPSEPWLPHNIPNTRYRAMAIRAAVVPIPAPALAPMHDMTATVFAGDSLTASRALPIKNTGDRDLHWQISSNGQGVLWRQRAFATSGATSEYSSTEEQGAYGAVDFTVSSSTTVSRITVQGYDPFDDLANQSAVTWLLYSDIGGRPNGHPESSTPAPLWSLSLSPTAAGVHLEGANITLDLAEAGQSMQLPAGTYWLTVYPTYAYPLATPTVPNWVWRRANLLGYQGLWTGSAPGLPNWNELGALTGDGFTDLALTIEGERTCALPSWLSVSSATGVTAPSGVTTAVDLHFDATGLQAGRYHTDLCVDSDDPLHPRRVVPVILDVVSDRLFGNGFE